MFNGKESKYHRKSKPHREHEVYSQSETSLGSSTWDYDDNPQQRKQVTFDTEYDDYTSQDNYYDGREKNLHSYPLMYDSSNIYDTEDDYYSDGSRYTHYHQSPQQIMYTGTDSAFTTADSNYENGGFGYQPKHRHDYSHGYRKKSNVPKKIKNRDGSSFREDVGVYFTRQPTNHQTFRYKEPRKHDVSILSEQEFQSESVTETDVESDYSKNDKRKDHNYHVYATNPNKNEINGAFKEEFSKNSKEMLISVTSYDNIPLLAFNTKKVDDSPQKSISRVVYLPVLVTGMQNEETNLAYKNANTQLFSGKNVDEAVKPVESLKVYAAVNTGQNNAFEKLQALDKTNGNEWQNSTNLKGKNTESNQNRVSKIKNQKSDIKSISKRSKTSYIYIPSKLRMSGTKKSTSSTNTASPISKQNQSYESKIKNIGPNISVTSLNSDTKAGNKRTSRISRKEEQNKLTLKSNNTLNDYEDKKGKSKKRSIISYISRKSSKSSASRSRNSSTCKTNNARNSTKRNKSNTTNTSNSNKSTSRNSRARTTNDITKSSNVQRLIGETPPGSEKGSGFYGQAHERELNARKETADRKSKVSQGNKEEKPRFSRKSSKKSGKFKLSIFTKGKDNNTKINSTTNTSSEVFIQPIQAPNSQVKRSVSKIKTVKSKSALLSQHNKSYDTNEDLSSPTLKESETKNRRQSVTPRSIIKPPEKSTSVIRSKNISKSVSQNVTDAPYRTKSDIKTENIGKKSDITVVYKPRIENESEPTSANDITLVRENSVSPKKSVLKNRNSNKTVEQDITKGSKFESRPPDQSKPIQGSRISIAKKNTMVRDTNVSKTKSEQNLIKDKRQSEIKNEQQLEDRTKNKREEAEELKRILQRRSQINGYQSRDQINEDISKGAVQEKKSTVQRKSQVFKSTSKEKINEEIKKSIVKETKGAAEGIASTGQIKSQVYNSPIKEKNNEEIKKSLVKVETTDAKDKGISITQLQIGTKSNVMKNTISDPNKGFVTEKGKKRESMVSLKPNEHGNEKTQKSVTEVNTHAKTDLNSEQKSIKQERQSSKVIRDNNQKSISKGSSVSVNEQKKTSNNFKNLKPEDRPIINKAGKQISTDLKYRSTVTDKSQSKNVPHKKEPSRVKSIPKKTNNNTMGYSFNSPIKLCGQNLSTLRTCCFLIAQFILGVSPYDKFIDVLGNFN